jgi:hypothetical protein
MFNPRGAKRRYSPAVVLASGPGEAVIAPRSTRLSGRVIHRFNALDREACEHASSLVALIRASGEATGSPWSVGYSAHQAFLMRRFLSSKEG